MESARLTRALKLLNLLQSGHGATVDYLAHALQCSKRTVFRDIKLLNDNNIRVWFDERLGGYTADHQLWALVSSLDAEELADVLIAAILSPVTQLGLFSGTVDQAVAKMMGRASRETRDRVNRLIRAIIPPTSLTKLTADQIGVFQQLVQAMATRRQVRIQWSETDAGLPSSTKLAPYQLAVEEGRWTVRGRSSVHRKVVGFFVSDIRSVEATDDFYEVPVEYLKAGPTGSALPRLRTPSAGTIPRPPQRDPHA